MNKKLLIIYGFFLGCTASFSQTISGKVINENSLQPMENVSIVTNLKTGTTTDKFGRFSLNLKDVKTVTFSFLGFSSKTIPIDDLKKLNYIIELTEIVNQLNEIQLNIAKISLDSLLSKTTKSMKNNYLHESVKQEMYAIDTQKMDFKKLELTLKSSSILSKKNKNLAEQELKEFSDNIQQKKPEFVNEFKAKTMSKEIYEPKLKKTLTFYKTDTIQGFKKADVGNGLTIKNVTNKLQNIVLKHLSNDKTYKVKSGWFKVEDSLSFKKVLKTNDSLENSNTFSNIKVSNYLMSIKKESVFFNKTNESNFFDRKYYNHKLEKNEVLGTAKYYVISFEPRKSKAKYTGKIHINPFDFSIKKIAYQFADGKRGDHINLRFLLGVKFSENKNEVTLFYETNEFGKIYPSYCYETKTSYAYVNRPIKFIENTEEKEKVKFNIKVEVNVSETTEVLLNEPLKINSSDIKPFKKEDFKKRTTYMSKEEYENSSWKNRAIIKQYLQKYSPKKIPN
ncbi:carboxypeptidase-like regulatory domain-containing protein [Polaribacter aestuariivivens]|uniref:carboxypeptidase-like regulatory domain-containing protein n=1 Tax=Polaribacter aestuariivivens TaxID=2304626 RepID=UPI003F494840